MANAVVSELYKTERRSGKSTKSKRRGPSLDDNFTKSKESEVLGKLFLGTNPNYRKKSRDIKRGLPGSKELLAYFHRLSCSDNHKELINVQYIKALLDADADVNVADHYGQTTLHAAARDWHPDVARFLIENGADVNKQDSFGRSPIFIAASLDYSEMVEFLVNSGADINMRTFGEKQTPLHYAAKNEAVSSIKCLLKLGADLSAKDYKERVPLHIAVLSGCEEAAQYFLDVGCPAAVFDRDGESVVAMMIEKMPLTAHVALSQFLVVDEIAGKKQYYLGSLHSTQSVMNEGKSLLGLIVKYNELDLLCHPVIQRMMKLEWDQYGYKNNIIYFLVNLFYVLLLSALAIIAGTQKHPFDAPLYMSLAFILLFLTIIFIIEQSQRLRYAKNSEQKWKAKRIESFEDDLRYCHPQWPHEREMIEAQISIYSNMVGDHFKKIWHYLDWATALSIVVLFCIRLANYSHKYKHLHLTFHVTLAITLFLAWLRFLKSIKAFHFCGQFISILGSVLIAVGQFAFLFFIFFIPFSVSFWILFGGDKNAEIIANKVSKNLANAFRNFNDVIYSVWTITLVVGFPLSAIKAIDSHLALAYVSLYYFVMSVVCLNLFIALLSQVFTNVYRDAYKYAYLEKAKSLVAGKALMLASKKREAARFLQEKCNPLTEELEFRKTNQEANEPDEIKLKRVKHEAQRLIKHFNVKTDEKTQQDQSFTIKKIGHIFSSIERKQNDYEMAISTLQKLKVENKKIVSLLGLQVKSQN